MLYLWVLTSLLQTCLGSGVYHSHVEAHGPLARQALDSMASAGDLHYYPGSFPATYTARAHAPVAPVDVVHHIPSVADVPVTKYSAQPGYVQKLVDVARNNVAVAKLQVTRPAIQKQFYDIEQRTVVRPVGSAVVELEEPISKKFVTPFTTHPTGYHTVAQFQRPLLYPVGPYQYPPYAPFQVPVQHYNPAFVQQTQQFQFVQPPQQFPAFPQRPVAEVPQPPQQQFPAAPQPPQGLPSFPQPSRPSSEESSSSEFDSSDTVVVDNPDFGRSATSTGPTERNEKKDSFEEFEKEVVGNENTINQQYSDQDQAVQNILRDFESRLALRSFPRQSKMLSQQNQNFQILLEPLRFDQQRQEDHDDNQLKGDEEASPKPQETPNSEPSTSTQTESSVSTTTQEASTHSSQPQPPAEFRSLFPAQREEKKANLETFSSQGQISSRRNLSPEELQDNQQRLIELFTGRGEVSEVSLSRSAGDSGVVRGRVISVTPAPRSSGGEDESQERVSTRRVVVSRPVQTVEEVDVHQPFTKVERVAVHEPALVKTAHTHIARVPTAIPVLSRAYAPVLYH